MEFPPTIVINLADRPQKWEQTVNSFAEFPVKLERLDAVRASPGWKGCAASHLKAIRLAKERNYDWVLVLEDDAELSKNGLKQFMELLPILYDRRAEWDIFLGGSTFVKNASVRNISPPIYEAYAYTAHFCLIHRDTYDKILNEYNDEAIDVYYAEKLRLWMTIPHIATQRPGLSDIVNGKTNYNKLFDDATRKLTMTGILYKCILMILAISVFLLIVITCIKVPRVNTFFRKIFGSVFVRV